MISNHFTINEYILSLESIREFVESDYFSRLNETRKWNVFQSVPFLFFGYETANTLLGLRRTYFYPQHYTNFTAHGLVNTYNKKFTGEQVFRKGENTLWEFRLLEWMPCMITWMMYFYNMISFAPSKSRKNNIKQI